MKRPVLLQSSNAVALNCDFHTLFFLSGFSAVKIWFTALLNYNSVNANYFQLSADQFSQLFPGCWQHDRLCCIDASKFQSRSRIYFRSTFYSCEASSLFCDATSCKFVNGYWRFGGAFCHHLFGLCTITAWLLWLEKWKRVCLNFGEIFHCLSMSFRYLVRTPTFYHSLGDSRRLDVTRLRRPAATFSRGTFVDGGITASHAGRLQLLL